mgnify:FL=1
MVIAGLSSTSPEEHSLIIRDVPPTTSNSSRYTVLDMDYPLHSSKLSLSEEHEFEGQVITVPTGIEAPMLCTMTFVGSKLVLSAASTGLEKTSDAKRRKRKR